MQAADELKFVRPFIELRRQENPLEDGENIQVLWQYLKLFSEIFAHNQSEAKSIERVSDVGFVNVFELPLRMNYPDGSYLHILLSGHDILQEDDPIPIDRSIAVIEHYPNGRLHFGYLYSISQEDGSVIRSNVSESQDSDEDDEQDAIHFSILALYEEEDYIVADGGETPELLSEYEKSQRIIMDNQKIFAMEQSLGSDGMPIDAEEMRKLAQLIQLAVPVSKV